MSGDEYEPSVPSKRKYSNDITSIDDEILQIRQELEIDKIGDKKLDVKKWLKLIKLIESESKPEDIVKIYEEYLKIFPMSSKQWIKLITFQISQNNLEQVEKLFNQCLTKVSDVDLWRCYVGYVRLVNDLITGGESARQIIIKAYEFAIDHCGVDLFAHDIYKDFLDFLDSWEPVMTTDQQKKIHLKRNLLRKMSTTPSPKIENYWQMYTTFENTVNQVTARKHIQEKSAEYMRIRLISVQINNLTKNLKFYSNESINEDSDTDHDIQFILKDDINLIQEQLKLWKEWISWEKLNKLNLSNELMNKRISFFLKKCTQIIPFSNESWFNYISFESSHDMISSSSLLSSNNNKNSGNGSDLLGSSGVLLASGSGSKRTQREIQDDLIVLLRTSLSYNPSSFALTVKLSNIFERRNEIGLVKETFQSLIDNLMLKDEFYEKRFQELKLKIDERDEQKLQQQKQQANISNDSETIIKQEELTSEELQMNQEFERIKKCRELISRSITSCFANEMKSVKRINGNKEARSVFSQARKYKRITWHVFYDYAMMEFHANEMKICLRSLELALKYFGKDIEFIIKYLNFLVFIKDLPNAKTVFETSIKSLLLINDLNSISKLFEHFIKIELDYGDLNAVKLLEKRYIKLFPNKLPFELFSKTFESDDHFSVVNAIDEFEITKIANGDSTSLNNSNNESDEPLLKRRDLGNGQQQQQQQQQQDITQLQQQKNNGINHERESTPVISNKPFNVRDEIYNLLRVLPKAEYYNEPFFDPEKTVAFFQKLNLN
ncbi:hypothetical protein B5S30_g987 [[Candida] boidinii]|nr:hypothetical protein B5S30_g987 [[Candida] boidinii]